ncbi:fluoride efflux transporter CrcB [Bacillus sp. FJAT-47783]|uniref:fluoride efflux transporter CrcB n=1 Tax=Bacillus sp. FJAT-47783 TaxID=2922712 RepID=UPI001FAB5AD5|nr:fluoride efflux transporter CrcB [Bacillus sp. FJAT-47783]
MKNYLAVGIGGVIGALLRYVISVYLTKATAPFPLGTMFVNFVGSFTLGFFTARWIEKKLLPSYIRTGIGTGLIGSFTTFSTFSVEFVQLLQEGHIIYALLYSSFSLVGGLTLAFFGYEYGRKCVVMDK